MVAFLSPDWAQALVDHGAGLPQRPGASAVVVLTVPAKRGSDDGATLTLALTDGRVAAATIGPDDEADFEIIAARDEHAAMARGDLDPRVGFMQGRIKLTGNLGRFLSLLPLCDDPAWVAVRDALAAETEF